MAPADEGRCGPGRRATLWPRPIADPAGEVRWRGGRPRHRERAAGGGDAGVRLGGEHPLAQPRRRRRQRRARTRRRPGPIPRRSRPRSRRPSPPRAGRHRPRLPRHPAPAETPAVTAAARPAEAATDRPADAPGGHPGAEPRGDPEPGTGGDRGVDLELDASAQSERTGQAGHGRAPGGRVQPQPGSGPAARSRRPARRRPCRACSDGLLPGPVAFVAPPGGVPSSWRAPGPAALDSSASS